MPTAAAIDIDGSEAVTTALLELLNRFPGLKPGDRILFSTVPEDGGIGFFPTSGAVYLQNNEDITGPVKQVCQYPFSVIYRAGAKSETQRLRIDVVIMDNAQFAARENCAKSPSAIMFWFCFFRLTRPITIPLKKCGQI